MLEQLSKLVNLVLKIRNKNEKVLKKLLKVGEMMKWWGFKGSVTLAKSLLAGFSKS